MSNPASARKVWMLNGPSVAAFASDPVASDFFTGACPLVVSKRDALDRVPAAWCAHPVLAFTSFLDLERAMSAGPVDPRYRYVLYDNERWEFTPEREQCDHALYTKKAAELTRAAGLRLIAAPAVNLAPPRAGSSGRYEDYLRSHLARDAARYADVVDIQAQGCVRATALFAEFVAEAAAQARRANPRVTVLAGLSTNPGGQRVTSQDVLRAIRATEALVDGYWMNVPRPGRYAPKCNAFRPDVAIDAFAMLGGRSKMEGQACTQV